LYAAARDAMQAGMKAPRASGTVRFERPARHVARITMQRPEVRNAQNTQLIEELATAMRRAREADDVRVVILAGAGPHFSSGHDLKGQMGLEAPDRWRRMRETAEGRYRHEREMYFDKCLEIYHLPKPTIAQVQGGCIAAGMMLACMCDLIVASEDAFFSNPVVRMTAAGVEMLVEPWEIGFRKAKEFLFTGEPIDAREAFRLGLANRVVPRAELADATLALARRIAEVPPSTLRMVKDSINQAQDFAGKGHSLRYHFLAHQFQHGTKTSLDALAERGSLGSVRAMVEARDARTATGSKRLGGKRQGGR
jgi:enoyl-CoA hydratase